MIQISPGPLIQIDRSNKSLTCTALVRNETKEEVLQYTYYYYFSGVRMLHQLMAYVYFPARAAKTPAQFWDPSIRLIEGFGHRSTPVVHVVVPVTQMGVASVVSGQRPRILNSE